MVAIFDIDETLLSTFNPFLNYMNKKYKTNFNRFDFMTYDWSKIMNLPMSTLFEEHINFLNNEEEMSKILPEIGVNRILNTISKYDEIYALTDRDITGLEGSKYVLDKLFPKKISKIIHTTSEMGKYQTPKVEILKQYDTKLFVDDSFKHVRSALDEGINAFLITRPWNKQEEIPKNRRLKNIYQLEKKINAIYNTKNL